MSGDLPRLQRVLGGTELESLRARLAVRCLNTAEPSRPFMLSGLNADEYASLCGLLGRPAKNRADKLRMSLMELDAAVQRAGLAGSLHSALVMLDGLLPDIGTERKE